MDIYIIKRKVLPFLLAAVLLVGLIPLQTCAATSAEIQKQIDALEDKNAEIQKQINAIQKQYDANFDDMENLVAQKQAIDQEIALLNTKIETTNEQITAYGQLIADTQDVHAIVLHLLAEHPVVGGEVGGKENYVSHTFYSLMFFLFFFVFFHYSSPPVSFM